LLVYRRYLYSEILKAATSIFLLAVVIYSCDCAILYLGESVSLSFPPDVAGLLVLLRVAIALEVIIPVAFFLAVVIALGRLYRDSEMTAFAACGLGMPQVLGSVCLLAVPLAVLTGFSSLIVRPDGWTRIYRTLDEAQARFDISRMNPRSFLELRSGQVVFFAEDVGDGSTAEDVFVRVVDADGWKVIRARQMKQSRDTDGRRILHFRYGSMYEPPRTGIAGTISTFQEASYALPDDGGESARYRRKATPTSALLSSTRPEDIAELQWRFSAPLSTLLLAVLAVPLSKCNPRRGKFARVGIAIVIFALYYQLFVLARTWVDDRTVAPFPGIWWVPALLSATNFWMLRRTGEGFTRGMWRPTAER
jgi:lipopolysaccharide export system permease protein